MADLLLKDVEKAYGEVKVLKDINLDIKTGELIVFVGPSGCGKSTLLRMIAGLERITGGEFTIQKENAGSTPSAIYVGDTAFARRAGVDASTLPSEAWRIKTRDGRLILAGGGTRGTLYATYHFLEDVAGAKSGQFNADVGDIASDFGQSDVAHDLVEHVVKTGFVFLGLSGIVEHGIYLGACHATDGALCLLGRFASAKMPVNGAFDQTFNRQAQFKRPDRGHTT